MRISLFQCLQNIELGNNTSLNTHPDLMPDQPQIAEILKKLNDSVELNFMKSLDKLRKKNEDTVKNERFSFIKDKSIIYINLSYISYYTRADFANK